jgi:urocanate hydratase
MTTTEREHSDHDRSDDDTAAVVPRSIGRLLDLLEIVVDEQGCNLTAAAHASGLTPTTALRYLRALEARGYVDRDGAGDYSAGPTLLRLAASLRDAGPLERLAATAQPHLDDLAERTGESAYLAVSDGRTASYVATAESGRAIRHVGWVGQTVPLAGSALGAALLEPGSVVTRTGAVEPDITAMSCALPAFGGLGVAVSIVGPQHRFGAAERRRHAAALGAVVQRLERELRIGGEDLAS